jgi:hypothetical protein
MLYYNHINLLHAYNALSLPGITTGTFTLIKYYFIIYTVCYSHITSQTKNFRLYGLSLSVYMSYSSVSCIVVVVCTILLYVAIKLNHTGTIFFFLTVCNFIGPVRHNYNESVSLIILRI